MISRTHSHAREAPQSNSIVTFSIRLPENYKEALQDYFKHEKGQDLSNGLRGWIYERMEKEGLK
jgi:phosphoserine aminotransferase